MSRLSFSAHPLAGYVCRHWWIVLLRGLAALVLGLYALLRPLQTAVVLLQMLGIFMLADGLLSVVVSATGHGATRAKRGTALARGLMGMAVGLGVLVFPLLSATVARLFLVYLAAFQFLASGALDLAAAIRFGRGLRHEWALIIGGILALGLGVMALMMPVAFGAAFVQLLGAFGVVSGVGLIAYSLMLRSWACQAAWPLA